MKTLTASTLAVLFWIGVQHTTSGPSHPERVDATKTTTTTTTAPAPPDATFPAPPDVGYTLAECQTVVADLLPVHPPHEDWGPVVCEPQLYPDWGGYIGTNGGPVHLTPPAWYDDHLMRFTYLHEVGHTWCVAAGDLSEACADTWAALRS